jgi:hypothetical protein
VTIVIQNSPPSGGQGHQIPVSSADIAGRQAAKYSAPTVMATAVAPLIGCRSNQQSGLWYCLQSWQQPHVYLPA